LLKHADDFFVREPRDIVDIPGIRRPEAAKPAARAESAGAQPPEKGPRKPFLMIWFRCCLAYGRLNKTPDGLFYEGRCPKCMAHLEVPVGDGGTNRRMFEAE
jgi:hypothetical protein